MHYTGRFAPSPTGPLHAGSLVAALASWLDARAHAGRWLVRIEDVDIPRCVRGADTEILRQLAAMGMVSDDAPQWQRRRTSAYEQALRSLAGTAKAYPCACTRAQIAAANVARGLAASRHGELIYPGTCRPEYGGLQGREARAWRLRVDDTAITGWHDRRLGPQFQRVGAEVGDFVLRRADGLWAYQLAVVVDDAAQGVTHVVRGEDLADNTARQCLLQQALGLATPSYLHVPLVLDARGQKLSKQHGAPPLDANDAVRALLAAARALDLPVGDEVSGHTPARCLTTLTAAWARRFDLGARV